MTPEIREVKPAFWNSPTSIHLLLMRSALIKKYFHCQGCITGRRLAGCAVGETHFPLTLPETY